MSVVTPATHPPLTPRERRSLLAAYKADDAVVLGAWLKTSGANAPEAAVKILVGKAKNAENNAGRIKSAAGHAAFKFCFFFAVYLMFVMTGSKAQNAGLWIALVQWLEPFISLAFFGRRRAEVARQAVLLLARTGDSRAVRYLARLWTPRPLTRNEADFNADVSRELARLLFERQGERFDRDTETALRRVIERACPNSRLIRVLRPRRDLTEPDADLLLGIIRHLSHERPVSSRRVTPTEDENALRRVAFAAPSGPHYDLLRDTTETLLRVGMGKKS